MPGGPRGEPGSGWVVSIRSRFHSANMSRVSCILWCFFRHGRQHSSIRFTGNREQNWGGGIGRRNVAKAVEWGGNVGKFTHSESMRESGTGIDTYWDYGHSLSAIKPAQPTYHRARGVAKDFVGLFASYQSASGHRLCAGSTNAHARTRMSGQPVTIAYQVMGGITGKTANSQC